MSAESHGVSPDRERNDDESFRLNKVVQLRCLRPLLECRGIGRDEDHDRGLQFYFNRPVSDDEMRYLHEVMQRAVALWPQEIDGA